MKYAIENEFPFEKIDPIAEAESYRKEINRPIYHIHKWWAKRLGSVFRSIVSGSLSEGEWKDFYENQRYSGKVVLDPFMGSGTTLGEAAKLGACVIGCDVNPVSTFLVTQALKNVDTEILEQEFRSIEIDIAHEIQLFYRTKIPGSSDFTQALYYFWVKTVETPEGEVIPLFSSFIFSKNAYVKRKPEAKIWCPRCESIITDRYDTVDLKCPCCTHRFNPQKGSVSGANVTDSKGIVYKIKDLSRLSDKPPKHKLYAIMALNENNDKVYIKPSDYDLNLYEEAKVKLHEIEGNLPLPTMAVRFGYNTNQAKGYNYHAWRQFFNDRQLLTLGLLLKRILQIEDKVVRDHFICLFSGTLEFNNMFCSFKGEGTGAVRHMFSNHILKPERTPLENNIWGIKGKSSGTFSTLFRSRLLKAKKYLDEPFDLSIEHTASKKITHKIICSDPINLEMVNSWDEFSASKRGALILNGDSSSLPIPDESVDAVITDPPYFDFVHYSELSDFFYAWITDVLGSEYPYLDKENCSHENEVQDRNSVNFTKKIGAVFKECYRVLKTDGLLSFSFHHSRIDGWMAIYNSIFYAGFNIVAAHPVKAEMSVSSTKSATKSPINIDVILVCKKAHHLPTIFDEEKEVEQKYSSYVNRFSKVGRVLSRGDHFVIACAQAIIVASTLKMDSDRAKVFVENAVEKCLLLN